MGRHYRKKAKDDDILNTLANIIAVLFIGISFYLVWLFKNDRTEFWKLSLYIGLVVAAVILVLWWVKKLIRDHKNKHLEKLITGAKETGQEATIKNFINRWGRLGNKKNCWNFRNHFIDWDRIDDLEKDLKENGLKLRTRGKNRDIFVLLRHFVQEKEANLTRESVKQKLRHFSDLSGQDFEELLVRLFTAKGYSTERIGKTGDQGGDLIANRDGKRILIQAKCYKDWSTGNNAVQQVVGAMKFYDCQMAAVVSTSHFTREAIELAEANHTKLIAKEELREMLSENLGEFWE